MDQVVARTLRPYEGRTLRAMKRQLSNAVNSRHARIILLSRGGECNREIAQHVGCSPPWVREVIHRFNDGGIDAITWYPAYCGRGQRRQLMVDVVEQIAPSLTPGVAVEPSVLMRNVVKARCQHVLRPLNEAADVASQAD